MDAVIAICRCGLELEMHGEFVVCAHCDQPCASPLDCKPCIKLRHTCNDCLTVHRHESDRHRCEQGHVQ